MWESIRTLKEKAVQTRKRAVEERQTSGEKTGIKTKIKAEKTLIAMVALLIVVRLVVSLGGTSTDVQYVPLTLGEEELYLEYAGNKVQTHQGLKQRPGLLRNGGMLFDLKELKIITVTMDKVNFPLKVASLDSDFHVLEVWELVPGQNEVRLTKPCRYFVEIHPEIQVQVGEVAREFRSTLNVMTRSLIQSGVF